MAKPPSATRWVILTLFVLIAVAGFIRLGFWQLARLGQRRAANAVISAQANLPTLNLNLVADANSLTSMPYRTVIVTGHYDFTHQVVQRNQVWEGQLGERLLTPLVIENRQPAILVDRGWIPLADEARSNWSKYDQPGLVTVTGQLLASQPEGGFGVAGDPPFSPNQTPLDTWRWINLERIGMQIPEPLFPVYLRQAPDGVQATPPYRSLVRPDLSDGPHLIYAIQWFFFAAFVLVGYPIYVRNQLRKGSPRRASGVLVQRNEAEEQGRGD